MTPDILAPNTCKKEIVEVYIYTYKYIVKPMNETSSYDMWQKLDQSVNNLVKG